MRLLLAFLLLLPFHSLSAQQNKLDVTAVAPGCWVHTSYGKFQNSYVPANGLIIENDHSVWIVDTGWGKKPARKLLNWVKNHLRKPVTLVIITHAHDDRAAGVAVFQKEHIPVYMTAQTAGLLSQQKVPVATYQTLTGEGSAITLDGNTLDWFFPGAGHAPDNIVLYFGKAHLLFGGCMVKNQAAQNLGNLHDANLSAWPGALRKVQMRFPAIDIVIPGHQAWGGPELIDHTLHLLETAPK
ncbi:MAG: subclass B1 metallo-beta-lactamase [Saprospiraceae bacterium]